MKGFVKDPDATLDYGFDWSLWLGTDTIQSSSWTVPSALSIVPGSETADDVRTSCFISGGVAGEKYIVTNQIVTVGQRTEERSFELYVEQR